MRGKRQHGQSTADHDPEREEWNGDRRPILPRDAVETDFPRDEAVRVDQAAEGRRQRDRVEVPPVLYVRPRDQHLGSRLLVVPARLDRSHLGGLMLTNIPTIEMSEEELNWDKHGSETRALG
jgi:hypothetical protein